MREGYWQKLRGVGKVLALRAQDKSEGEATYLKMMNDALANAKEEGLTGEHRFYGSEVAIAFRSDRCLWLAV